MSEKIKKTKVKSTKSKTVKADELVLEPTPVKTEEVKSTPKQKKPAAKTQKTHGAKALEKQNNSKVAEPKAEVKLFDEEEDELTFYEKSMNWIKYKVLKKKKEEPVVTPNARRIKADSKVGLTLDQVEDRVKKGFTNRTDNRTTKSYKAIFFGNIFTFFNILCFSIAIALLIVKAPIQQILFIFIIIANLAIGIIQEIKAKKTIEKLSLLTAPSTTVLRQGKEYTVSVEEVVLDDIVIYGVGKQIVADCIIIEGNCEANESLLTGESLPIKKKVGSTLLSGSFISSGSCKARVMKIGKDSYVEQLTSKAKRYKKPKSELFNSLNSIIKVIGFIIIPIAVLMFINNYNTTGNNISETVQSTAGSIIGMIPAGMFLLCSVALTVSVIRLAQQKALVQDLYCVEMLARVNVLCLDKTGTITDGTMKVYNSIELQNKTGLTLKRIMGSLLSSLPDNNQTSQALINYFGYNKELKNVGTVPFSSSRKYSAASFEGVGTFVLGAPEFVIPNLKDAKVKDIIEQYAKDGYRVLMLAHSSSMITKGEAPASRSQLALLILEDRIRDDAIETIKWFKENDVKIKIISGDNPLTVAEIAKRVGVDDTESFINLEGMNENQVRNAANKYTVFGRVSPEQKAILIRSIKAQGNTVAMTGDGVNDILALKESDCSIAMASGSDAVRSVSHMVLMDSNFSSMPQTVIEGRRVINNVQKSSALFFMKTIFTIIFSIIILILNQQYPLKTSQLILMEYFVIGIPSFFLALQPNNSRVSGKFIYNLFKNALPGAITLIINASAVYLFVYLTQGSLDDIALLKSMMTIILTFTGIALLLKLCKPITPMTGILFATMAAICFSLIVFAPELFEITSMAIEYILFIIILSITSVYLVNILYKVFDKLSIGGGKKKLN